MNQVLNKHVAATSERSAEAITKLKNLTESIENQELSTTVQDILNQLDTPFTFVIVGEVKAGKSSFINALLESRDKDICKVAPHPMTDTIQQIMYGDEVKEEVINPYLKNIYQPVDILREIAIVDTPGTNTISEHHQEITERFIPHSDLIVFVFEGKNPYRQSSWDFFDFINEEWRRKIIFVLQQKDLVAPDDLVINTQGVVDQAKKKGLENPQVFVVSAKEELEMKTDVSGFKDIRKYIADNITGGRAPYLKIQNNVNTALTINEKISHSLDLRQQQWELDKQFRNGITDTLELQEGKTAKQIDLLIENLLATYDRISQKRIDRLEKHLRFGSVIKRTFGSVFGSSESLKSWLKTEADDFETELNAALQDKLNNGIVDVADNIQTMGKLVHSKIQNSQTILKDSDEIFADIAEKRANVLKDLQTSFSDFMKNKENFYDEQLIADDSDVAPNLAAGSGLAVVGVILTIVTQGAVFDITGGILTAVGLGFAGVSLGLNKKKVLTGFKNEIAKGRVKLENEVSEKLKDYTVRIKQKIDDNFYQLDTLLDSEEQRLQELDNQMNDIEKDLHTVKIDVEKHL